MSVLRSQILFELVSSSVKGEGVGLNDFLGVPSDSLNFERQAILIQ